MTPRDLALFEELYCDAETMRYISAPMTRRDARTSFHATLRAMRAPAGPCFLVLRTARGGRAVGLCSLQRVDARHRRVELGIMLTARSRGRGLASECLRAVTDFAFEALPIDSIWVQYRSANAAAERVFSGLGFLPSGSSRARTARRMRSVGVLTRPAWRDLSSPLHRGIDMSSIVAFLEVVGRDASLRHADRDRLLLAMQREGHAGLPIAISGGGIQIEDIPLLPRRIHCLNFPVRVPKKAPPKKPGKPPAKTPTKKPAKKAPAKKAPAKKRS